MSLRVFNNTDSAKVLRANDGDSVLVMPRSVVEVDAKFDWIVPVGVRLLDQPIPAEPASEELTEEQLELLTAPPAGNIAADDASDDEI